MSRFPLAFRSGTTPSRKARWTSMTLRLLLVVDDNKVNRYLMMGMFEKTHHRLRFATNGKEALERLGEMKFDVVLLDIRMPVMDGRAALTEIRKRPELESLPVIAVTASSKASEDA